MINYVKRKDLDPIKYDDCVKDSAQSRVYAFSWYLDIVADNWDVLVLDDYEAVMPLPWNSKYGLKYVVQPYFCQQIQVYSTNEIDVELFLKAIPYYFTFIRMNISVKPNFDKINIKQNFSLNLDNEYSVLNKNYRKDRRKSLRKAIEAGLTYKDFDNKKELIILYKDVFNHLNNPEKYYQTIDAIMSCCLKNKHGFVRNVYFKEELVCAGFFANFNNRIYYLFAASSTLGKKYGATTFLIDSVIKQYSNTKTIFDFEGSTIPNIASFYKSFGGEMTNYYYYNTNVFQRIFI